MCAPIVARASRSLLTRVPRVCNARGLASQVYIGVHKPASENKRSTGSSSACLATTARNQAGLPRIAAQSGSFIHHHLYPSRSHPQPSIPVVAASSTADGLSHLLDRDDHHQQQQHHHHHGEYGATASEALADDKKNEETEPKGIWRFLEWLEEGTAPTVGKIVFLAASALAPTASYQHLLLAGTYALAGPPALADLGRNVVSGNIDTHVLMALAALGTVLCGHPTEGALLLTMFQTSHLLEHRLTARAHGNLEQLFAGLPATALAVDLDPDSGAPRAASAVARPAESFQPGNTILVRPGSQVPLDGRIVYGSAAVSAEALTGESVPTRKGPGDDLPAGALVHDGSLALRVTAHAAHSTPARMASLAMSAQTARPRLKSLIERFGGVYTRAVLWATALALGGMLLAGVPFLDTVSPEMNIAMTRGAAYRAMGLLTVASPCALVVAPLAYVAAIAALANRGVLVTGGAVLDALPGCSVLALDKTGTLTVGAPKVAAVESVVVAEAGSGGSDEKSSLRRDDDDDLVQHLPTNTNLQEDIQDSSLPTAIAIAAALSALSTHPMSGATLAYAAEVGSNVDNVAVKGFRLVPGSGVSARVRLHDRTIFAQKEDRLDRLSTSYNLGDEEEERHLLNRTYSAWFGAVDWVACTLDERSRLALESAAAEAHERGRAASALVLHAIERGDELELADDEGVCAQEGGQRPLAVWLWEFADTPRRSSIDALTLLTQDGTFPIDSKVRLVTGDNVGAALGVARQLSIPAEHVHAGLSPEDKLNTVRSWQQAGERVLFVGDGLNDAAALAAADVGVAVGTTLGGATGLAADAALVAGGGIAALPLVIAAGQRTQRVVRQNLAIAVAAAAAMAPATLAGVVPLWAAVAVHEGSTLLVAANSLRLLHQKHVATPQILR